MDKDCKALVIAVDGYSSTGKSTVAKIVAARLGYTYIDTGAMYRVVTLFAMRKKLISDGTVDKQRLRECLSDIEIGFKYNDSTRRYETYMNHEYVEEAIRALDVAGNVSMIATIDFVREFLVDKQRAMGKCGGVIMDGRDIGSVVFPDADVKFFMTSSPEVRARRRYKELVDKGEKVSYEEVEANVRQRDYVDENREISPLTRVADAILIDSSNMTVEEEVDLMIVEINKKC